MFYLIRITFKRKNKLNNTAIKNLNRKKKNKPINKKQLELLWETKFNWMKRTHERKDSKENKVRGELIHGKKNQKSKKKTIL